MSKPVKELREFDRVEATPLWAAIETRGPGPEVPPPPNHFRRAVVTVSALALFVVAAAFAWSAFHPSGEPATVGSGDSTPLVATLDAPDNGAIPGLTLAYGDTSRAYFAEGGHWPGVNGFDLPGFGFGTPLPSGTSLTLEGDASHVEGDVSKFQDVHSTADTEPIRLDFSGGSATLPTDPGRYQLHLTGTWPKGTAEFFVVIEIAPASPSSLSETITNPRGIPITVSYPAGWVALANSGDSKLYGTGLVVLNDQREATRVFGRSETDWFGTHIRDFVGVTVFKARHHAPVAENSSFPLDMADSKVDSGWGQESVHYLNAQVDGMPIRIMVLAAKDASAQDIAAADAIVASIRPTGSTASPAATTTSFTAEDFVDGTAPLGTELANALGLTLESGFHGNCSAFVEVANDGQGYCVQDVFESKIDLFAISDALRGHRITEAELEVLQHNLDCAQQAEQGSMNQDCYPGSQGSRPSASG